MLDFVHLHVHSHYSIGDGFVPVADLVQHAHRLGMRALALTDLHTLAGVPLFRDLCAKTGIKPIVGAELNVWFDDETVVDDGHHRMVFIVDSEEGYCNLVYLVNLSNHGDASVRGIRYSQLSGRTAGLIAIVGGLHSWLRHLMMNFPVKKTLPYLEFLMTPENDLFDHDRLMVALEPCGDDSDAGPILNLYNAASTRRLVCVAMSNVRALTHDDTVLCDLLDDQPIANDFNFAKHRRLPSNRHMLTSAEMKRRLSPEFHVTIQNTMFVMDRCSGFQLNYDRAASPSQDFVRGMDAETYVCDCALKNAAARLSVEQLSDEVRERLDEELSDIRAMNWSNNMLLLHEIARYCREEKYVMGIGRGRILSSLVAYILGITQINPLNHHFKYLGLKDENEELAHSLFTLRIEVPRHFSYSLSRFLVARLGTEHSIVVGRYERSTPTAIWNKLCAWIGLSREESDGLYSEVVEANVSAIVTDQMSSHMTNIIPKNVEFLRFAYCRLRNLLCGLVPEEGHFAVSGDNLIRVVPVNDCWGTLVAQFDVDGLTSLRIPQLMIAENPMLDMLDMGVRCVRSQDSVKFDSERIPTDDEDTYDQICNGATLGVELLADMRLRTLLREHQPRNFIALTRLLSSDLATQAGVRGDILHRAPDILLAYRLMFVKTHFPRAFYAALLTATVKERSVFMRTLREVELRKFTIYPPDINNSHYHFDVVPKGIIAGLITVEGMTRQAYEVILHARNSGEFQGVLDFCSRTMGGYAHLEDAYVSADLVESLIHGGAFDMFNYSRSELLWYLQNWGERARDGEVSECSTASAVNLKRKGYKQLETPKIPALAKSQHLMREERCLGWNLGYELFSRWTKLFKMCSCDTAFDISMRNVGKKLCVAGLMNSKSCRLDETTEIFDIEGKPLAVTSATRNLINEHTQFAEPVMVAGTVEKVGRELRLAAQWIVPVRTVRALQDAVRTLTLDLQNIDFATYRQLRNIMKEYAGGTVRVAARSSRLLRPAFPFKNATFALSPILFSDMNKCFPPQYCSFDVDIEAVPHELRTLFATAPTDVATSEPKHTQKDESH